MKHLKFILFIFVVIFSACSNSEEQNNDTEKISEFISNFKELSIPISSSELPEGKVIENEYISVLVDTTGGFSRNYPDGELHFKTEYYYIGKISSKNENFDIIIVAEYPTTAVYGLMDGALYKYNLYTISSDGKIIANIPFAYHFEGGDWGLTGTISENFEIETIGDLKIKYKIENDGKIVKISEEEVEELYSFADFVNDSYSPEDLYFNSENTDITELGEMSIEQMSFFDEDFIADEIYKPIVFPMDTYTAAIVTINDYGQITSNLYIFDNSGVLMSSENVIFAMGGNSEFYHEFSAVVKSKDGLSLQIDVVQIIGDRQYDEASVDFYTYKINNQGVITKIDKNSTVDNYKIDATFTRFDLSNYYIFTTKNGNEFSFKELPENCEYDLVFQGPEMPEGLPNQDFVGKEFEIIYHEVGTYSDSIKYYNMDKIELLK